MNALLRSLFPAITLAAGLAIMPSVKAGVRSTLLVGEGMGHCYIYNDRFPEAHDAWGVILRFFRENLK